MAHIFDSYKKARKVVTSCESKEQLEGAKKYVNQFLEIYSEVTYKDGKLETNTLVSELYDRLLCLVYLKKHQLKSI